MRASDVLHNVKRLERAVRGHSGITSVQYTSVTRSLLVVFDPAKVTREEIIVRVGLSFELDNGSVPVHIFSEPEHHTMSNSAFYSGYLLGIALLYHFGSRASGNGLWLEWFAGLGTSWAVLEHGVEEVREQGNFDPEVLSLVYLVTAFLRGNVLPAAIFTWLTTFGRHLIQLPSRGIELRPVEFADEQTREPLHEVVITSITSTPEKRMLFRLLPAIVKYAAKGEGANHGNLIDEIRNVSNIHNEVLEGLGGISSGIPLKIR
jgi:hypothetical protein